MKLIVWVKIEIEGGGVRVTDGNWRMALDNGERMPDGDAVQIIERQLTERSITMPMTATPADPMVVDAIADRQLQESYDRHHTVARAADGRPGPMVPRTRLLDDLMQIGIAPEIAKSLCDQHGAGRIESLLKWMASKTEPVGNPARLLLACLSSKRS